MPLFVYMTAPDMAVAERIADLLVTRRLAACVNVLPGVRSVYWWDGVVERGQEVALIAKTEEDRYRALEQAVLEAHPYDCPCIVALPINRANPEFASWITASTREEE